MIVHFLKNMGEKIRYKLRYNRNYKLYWTGQAVVEYTPIGRQISPITPGLSGAEENTF